jgi:hypothetical protein
MVKVRRDCNIWDIWWKLKKFIKIGSLNYGEFLLQFNLTVLFLTGEAWFNKWGCVSKNYKKKSTQPLPDIIRHIEQHLQVADILRLLLRLCRKFFIFNLSFSSWVVLNYVTLGLGTLMCVWLWLSACILKISFVVSFCFDTFPVPQRLYARNDRGYILICRGYMSKLQTVHQASPSLFQPYPISPSLGSAFSQKVKFTLTSRYLLGSGICACGTEEHYLQL